MSFSKKAVHYLWLPQVGRVVVESCVDSNPFYPRSSVWCKRGEGSEHILDIGAQEVAPDLHPRVGHAWAVEGPLVKMGIVVAKGVVEVAAVNVVLKPEKKTCRQDGIIN